VPVPLPRDTDATYKDCAQSLLPPSNDLQIGTEASAEDTKTSSETRPLTGKSIYLSPGSMVPHSVFLAISTSETQSSLSSAETVANTETESDFVSQLSETARPNGMFRLHPYLAGYVSQHYQTEIGVEEGKIIAESGGIRSKSTRLAAVHRVVAQRKQTIIADKGGEEAFMAECMKKTEEKNRLKEKKHAEKKLREIPAEVAPIHNALDQLKTVAKKAESKDGVRTVIFVASQAGSTTNMSHYHSSLKSFHDHVKPFLEEHLALKDPTLSEALVFSPDTDMMQTSSLTDSHESRRSDLRKYFKEKMKKAWGVVCWNKDLPPDLEVLNWPAAIPFVNPGFLSASQQHALNAVKHNIIFVKKTVSSSSDIKTETLRHLNQLLKVHSCSSSSVESGTSTDQSRQIEWLRNLIFYGMSAINPSPHSATGPDSGSSSSFQPLSVSSLTL